MFVQPAHWGKGYGRALLDAAVAKAQELGYKAIWLDSATRLERAGALYRKAGFKEIAPYRFNPAPDAVYMELKL